MNEAYHYIDRSPELTKLLDWVVANATNCMEFAMLKNDPIIQELIWLKAIHIGHVVERAVQIAQAEGKDVEEAIALAFLHDYARFEQAHFKSFSDMQTNFNHALKGADYYRADPEIWGLYPEKNDQFYEATAKHSDPTVDTENPHAKEIRDYDKMGLLKEIEFYVTWNFGKQLEGNTFSEKVLSDFLNWQVILHGDRHTKADQILSMVAWIFDLNLVTSKQIFIKEQVDERAYTLLRNIGTQESEIQKVKTRVEEWKQLVSVPVV